MAVEIRHSRTATLVDSGANPGYDANEIQASDWNDTHPITADGMGLLFANSAGAVAETMTVDTGTVTASTPFTFRQAWSDATNTVTFKSFIIRTKIVDGSSTVQGAADSDLFNVQLENAAGNPFDLLRVRPEQIGTNIPWKVYEDFSADPVITVDPTSGGSLYFTGFMVNTYLYPTGLYVGETGYNAIQYRADGITVEDGSRFRLPEQTQTKFASWAGAPTTSDIAAGYAQVGKDTSTGNVWLAVNDGGTIKKVQLT